MCLLLINCTLLQKVTAMASVHDFTAEFDSFFQITEGMHQLQVMAQSMKAFTDQAKMLSNFGKGGRIATLKEMEGANRRLIDIGMDLMTSQFVRAMSQNANTAHVSKKPEVQKTFDELTFQATSSLDVFYCFSEKANTFGQTSRQLYEDTSRLKRDVEAFGYAAGGLHIFRQEILKLNTALSAVQTVRGSRLDQSVVKVPDALGTYSQGGMQAAFGARAPAFVSSFKAFEMTKFNLGGNGYDKLKVMMKLISSIELGLSSIFSALSPLKTEFLSLAEMFMKPFGLLITGMRDVGYGMSQLWKNWLSMSGGLRHLRGQLVAGLVESHPYDLIAGGVTSLFGSDESQAGENIILQNKRLQGSPFMSGAATVATVMTGAAVSLPAIDLMQRPHPVVDVASTTASYGSGATTYKNNITYIQEVTVSVNASRDSQPEDIRRQVVAALDESYEHFKRRMKEDERRKVRKSYDDFI